MKKYLWLLILAVAATVLPSAGGKMNTFVMSHNGYRMPVWVMNREISIDLIWDFEHAPWTKHSKYLLLSDIIPCPDYFAGKLHWDMMSAGDVVISAGQFSVLACPLFGLYLLLPVKKRSILNV